MNLNIINNLFNVKTDQLSLFIISYKEKNNEENFTEILGKANKNNYNYNWFYINKQLLLKYNNKNNIVSVDLSYFNAIWELSEENTNEEDVNRWRNIIKKDLYYFSKYLDIYINNNKISEVLGELIQNLKKKETISKDEYSIILAFEERYKDYFDQKCTKIRELLKKWIKTF